MGDVHEWNYPIPPTSRSLHYDKAHLFASEGVKASAQAVQEHMKPGERFQQPPGWRLAGTFRGWRSGQFVFAPDRCITAIASVLPGEGATPQSIPRDSRQNKGLHP